MLYVKAYNEKLQQCIIRDTADGTEEKVEVSEVRKIVNGDISIPGVFPDRIKPVTIKQANEIQVTRLRSWYADRLSAMSDSDFVEVTIDCAGLDELHLVSICGLYNFENESKTKLYLDDLTFEAGDLQSLYFSEFRFIDFSKSGIKKMTEVTDAGCGLLDVRTMILPDCLESVIGRVFYNDDGVQLKNLKISRQNKFFSTKDGVLFNKNKTELIKIPPCASFRDYIVPDGVKRIGDDAFLDCRNLESITLPKSIEEIAENDVFLYCSRLRRVYVPKGVSPNVQRRLSEEFGNSSVKVVEV